MTDRRRDEKPACSVTSAPFPTEVTCGSCGEEVEVWSDDTEITCGQCGSSVGKGKNQED
jgi:ribosomal protein S27E